jgi:hypothetical protein
VQGGYHDGFVNLPAGSNGFQANYVTVATMTIQNSGPYAVFATATAEDGNQNILGQAETLDVICNLTSTNGADAGEEITSPSGADGFSSNGISLMLTSPDLNAGDQVNLNCKDVSISGNAGAFIYDIKITAIEASNMITQAL